jgi:hypothetical protein
MLVRTSGGRDHRSSSSEKEIEMTTRSRLRLGAKLLGITCLVVSLGVAASASASGNSSAKSGANVIARMASRPYCPPRTICLYPDSNFRGTQRRYGCQGWAPGSYRSADLGRYFPWGTHAGVSSYQNAGVPHATLQIVHRNGSSDQPSLPRNSSGNLARQYNDVATKLYVRC